MDKEIDKLLKLAESLLLAAKADNTRNEVNALNSIAASLLILAKLEARKATKEVKDEH
jgi:hypothetical protein